MSKYLKFNMQWMINNANDWGVEFTFKNGDPYYSVRENASAKSGYLQEKVKEQLK
jgi:hypothetical protein